MIYRFFMRGLAGAAVCVLVCALFGAAVMLLWNGLMPALFGLPSIGYLQAAALLVLARILFGGMGGAFLRGRHVFGGSHDNPFREKWLAMSDAERKEFWTHHHDFFRERSRADKPREDDAGK
ncbi:MAG: hypothetical protein LBI94_08120 [Treponema sp.]|jgi:hypothetical protein|nr:hypothetical protein [Treponema sp.]